MSSATALLPKVRRDLVISQISDSETVVKIPSRGEYFSLGQEESFLLDLMQSETTADFIRTAFEKRFGEKLAPEDVDDFLKVADSRGLFESDASVSKPSSSRQSHDEDDEEDFVSTSRQSLLSYRLKLFDPDQFLNWLTPQISWVWSIGFVLASLATMGLALCITLANRQELLASFSGSMRWETVVLVWIVLIAASMAHEIAHGLTCKRFGGEVHDVGVMLMFFLPCMYCNVTDAWLIREKWKRLAITAAGGYCDLCLWALAVLVWRITVPDCLVNYLAFMVLTVCGTRGLINFNPLLRLDGYYLLSDWLALANLRKRSHELWMDYVRSWLWGAARPKPQQRGLFLVCYGALCWFFAIGFLDFIFWKLLKTVNSEFGVIGVTLTCLLLAYAMRRVFRGFFRSEFMAMIKTRPTRTVMWLVGIASVLGAPFLLPVKHYCNGDFEVRPGTRHEIHAAVPGFIQRIPIEEGSRVAVGDVLVELSSPDLTHQIGSKEAELREVSANLQKLKLGARSEEVSEQQKRIERLRAWCLGGERDLENSRRANEQELVALSKRVEQAQSQLDFAKKSYTQSEALFQAKALAGAQLRSEKTNIDVLESQLAQTEAERRVREVNGVQSAASELERRRQELADAEAKLTLLQAGTRKEEISAEVARRDRVEEEISFLKAQKEKLVVRSTVSGIVATPRMHEKIGQMVVPGSVICSVEDGSKSCVEIVVSEDDVNGLTSGQPVVLKARSLPFDTFNATVERVAPSTVRQESKQRTVVVVHCQLENSAGQLKSGMTGFGRILRGWNSLGFVIATKAMRYLRTEFWW